MDAVPRPEPDAESRPAARPAPPPREWAAFQEAARRIAGLSEPDQIVARLLEASREGLRTARIALFLREDAGTAWFPAPGSAPALPLPAAGVVERVIAVGEPVTVGGDSGRTLGLVPLVLGATPVGLLVADVTALGDAAPDALEALAAVANQAAGALQATRLLARFREQNRSLERTRTFLGNILDSITNGIMAMDLDNRIIRINRNLTAMLELSDEDVLNRPFAEALPEPLRSVLGEMLNETAAMGFTFERQYQHRSAEGLDLPLAIGMSRLLDESMQPIGAIAVFRDMTASRELERLRRIDQLKSQFVSNVTHELKTPLTSIRAYTEALKDMVTDDTQRHFLQVVDEESERLLYLIEDLLNIGRIESGKLQLKFSLCQPRSLVEEVLNISKVQSKKHKIALDIPDGLPAMMVDTGKMKEVMINLLSNAIKYSPKGGEVRVVMRLVEANLEIRVSDQGIGIAKENLPKLFQAFYRVDSSLTAEIGGTGLGLAIVKAIIEAHGGKVSVESEPGSGTTFAILLPVRKDVKPHELDDDRKAGSLLA